MRLPPKLAGSTQGEKRMRISRKSTIGLCSENGDNGMDKTRDVVEVLVKKQRSMKDYFTPQVPVATPKKVATSGTSGATSARSAAKGVGASTLQRSRSSRVAKRA